MYEIEKGMPLPKKRRGKRESGYSAALFPEGLEIMDSFTAPLPEGLQETHAPNGMRQVLKKWRPHWSFSMRAYPLQGIIRVWRVE